MVRGLPVAALVACGLCIPAAAHSPYLLPNTFDVSNRKHVTVEGSFTEDFFTPEVAMKADDYHVIAPDGTKHALTPIYTQDLAVLEVPTTEPGTYRITTGQRTGRISKAAYRDGEWDFLEPDKAPPEGATVYDVQSITTAEVFVSRGKPDQTALAPRNEGLEFRAVSHPNTLLAGTEARFQVLFEGKPLPHHEVSVHCSDERYAPKKPCAEIKTDRKGQFGVRVDNPGIYLATTRYRVLPSGKGGLAISHTYSITFEVTE